MRKNLITKRGRPSKRDYLVLGFAGSGRVMKARVPATSAIEAKRVAFAMADFIGSDRRLRLSARRLTPRESAGLFDKPFEWPNYR